MSSITYDRERSQEMTRFGEKQFKDDRWSSKGDSYRVDRRDKLC